MKLVSSKNFVPSILDSNEPFCGVVEVGPNSVTLLIVPKGAFSMDEAILASIPKGQATEIVEGLKGGSLEHLVTNLPKSTSQWPSELNLRYYKPKFTPTNNLSKSTPSVYSLRVLPLTPVNGLHILAQACGGTVVAGLSVDLLLDNSEVGIEILSDFYTLSGMTKRNSPLGRWVRENNGFDGRNVVALIGPGEELKALYLYEG